MKEVVVIEKKKNYVASIDEKTELRFYFHGSSPKFLSK